MVSSYSRILIKDYSDYKYLFEDQKVLNDYINIIPNIAVVINSSGKIISINKIALEFLGYELEDCLNHSMLDFLEESSRNFLKKRFELIKKDRKFFEGSIELVVLKKDGSSFDLACTETLFLKDNKVKLLFVVGTDISYLKNVEKKLSSTSTFLKQIIESNSIPTFIINEQRKITLYNNSFIEFLGLSKIKYENEDIFKVCDPSYARNIIRTANKVFKTKKLHTGLCENINTPKHFINILQSPLIEKDGKVKSVLGLITDETQKELLERELMRERNLLKSIMKTSPIGITRMNEKGEIIYMNNRARIILEDKKEDLINIFRFNRSKKLLDYNDNFIEEQNLPYSLVRKKKKPVFDLKYKFKSKKNIYKYLSINSSPILDKERKFQGIISIISDITKTYEDNLLLKDREEILRALFDSSPDAIFVHKYMKKGFGKFLEVNKVACQRLGYSKAELLQLTPADVSLPIDTETKGSMDWRSNLSEDSIITFQVTHVRKNGETIPTEVRAILFKYKGELVELSVATDLTEKTKLLFELEKSRNSLETLMSNLPGMVYRCDNNKNWTMHFVSDGCTRLTGYDSKELIDNKKIAYNDIIHPKDRKQVYKTIQEAIAKNSRYELEYRIITKSAEIKWVWEKGVMVYSNGGKEILEGLIVNITSRKIVEQKLKRTLDELEKSNHDLKRLNDFMIGRELKMRELKSRIKELEEEID